MSEIAVVAIVVSVLAIILAAVTSLVNMRRRRADMRWKAFIEETSHMSGDELWRAYRLRGGHRE